MKYDHLGKASVKTIFDLLQARDLQNANLRSAVNFLMQHMVTAAFANDSGLVNWAGDGNSVQTYASAILKEKCKRAGAAEAEAARGMPM